MPELDTTVQKEELLKFIKEAFVIDGDVELEHKTTTYITRFLCKDSKRGTFYVSMGNENSGTAITSNSGLEKAIKTLSKEDK
jgi:hypothetical protein